MAAAAVNRQRRQRGGRQAAEWKLLLRGRHGACSERRWLALLERTGAGRRLADQGWRGGR
jgi:hypothetical protein